MNALHKIALLAGLGMAATSACAAADDDMKDRKSTRLNSSH